MSTPKSTILLVDDDRDLLRLLSIRLTAAGYAVITAESGEQAIAQLAATRPQLVITDLRMGGMDGMALFEAIRQFSATLPVIILTAHGSIPEAVAATKLGVFGFITKPFDSQALLDQVESALRASGVSSDSSQSSPDESWHAGLITQSPLMQDLLAQAKLVAAGS